MTNKEQSALIPGSGNVSLELDGETVTLRPSLAACLGISRMHGSPAVTAEKVQAMDFDACVQVLALGLGVAPNKRLQEKVYKTGMVEIRAALITFIHIVNNGGRPIANELAGDEEGSETENPQVPSL